MERSSGGKGTLSLKKNPRVGLPHEAPIQEVGDQGTPEAGLFLYSQLPQRLSARSQAWGSSTRASAGASDNVREKQPWHLMEPCLVGTKAGTASAICEPILDVAEGEGALGSQE